MTTYLNGRFWAALRKVCMLLVSLGGGFTASSVLWLHVEWHLVGQCPSPGVLAVEWLR